MAYAQDEAHGRLVKCRVLAGRRVFFAGRVLRAGEEFEATYGDAVRLGKDLVEIEFPGKQEKLMPQLQPLELKPRRQRVSLDRQLMGGLDRAG